MGLIAIVCIVAAASIVVVGKVCYRRGVHDGKGLPRGNGAA